MIQKILIPHDPAVFKQELLKRKRAKRTLIYKDGSVKVEVWNASRFAPSSDLMGNIDSQLWKRQDKAKIVKAVYEIEDLSHDDFFNDVETAQSGELFIHYQKGWSSFVPVNEYMTEYVIDNDTITVFYHVGFQKGRRAKKRLPAKDMQLLRAILNKAMKAGALADSNTEIRTVHGPVCTYRYRYCGISGNHCGTLICDNVLRAYYDDLIQKLIQ